MAANIFATNIQRGTFRDGRSRLSVTFSSTKGGFAEFEWTPAWMVPNQGVAELVVEAVRVEKSNRPGSDYLNEFAQLARKILVEHAPPAEVRRETGEFVGYKADGRSQPEIEVQLREWTGNRFWEYGRQTWRLGVPLPDKVLEFLARTNKPLVTWVVWNDEVIDILDSQKRSLIPPA